ncbi:MAG: tyrosine-type recombinase/integrase [Bacteroidales bacterium]|nr:tyrosine-type recombinase/integrase [Bacteroidales bacterium]
MSKRPQYSFTKAIERKLNGFKSYLQQLGNDPNTIRQKSNYAGYFLTWLESEHLRPQETRYNDLLNFIDYCKLEGNSKKHINSKLRSIRNYYEYLKKQNPDIINPALNLHLKGIKQKLPSQLISFSRLEDLYQSFETVTDRDKRNKVILGLLIYQGLTTEELHQLEVNHLELKKGKIHIPGNRRRKGRTLTLKPFQILDLYEYEIKIRPKLLQQETDQLIISMEGNRQLKNSLHHLFCRIRKTHPEIQNPKQIRASVITYWLKDHNLRQVQYMAGHKYVSSTERYQLNNLDKLQDKLEKYHPLNQTKSEY